MKQQCGKTTRQNKKIKQNHDTERRQSSIQLLGTASPHSRQADSASEYTVCESVEPIKRKTGTGRHENENTINGVQAIWKMCPGATPRQFRYYAYTARVINQTLQDMRH